MAAGFHHFAITRKICKEFDQTDRQSNILGHYSSVYADGMKGKISEINIQALISKNQLQISNFYVKKQKLYN